MSSPTGFDRRRPQSIALASAWLLAITVATVTLLGGARSTDAHGALRWAVHAVYVVALLWYLAGPGSKVESLPEIRVPARWRGLAWLPAAAVAGLLLFTLLSDGGVESLMLLLLPATLLILLVWWRDIRAVPVVQGVALALIAYAAGVAFERHGMASATLIRVLSFASAPMYVAGGLLIARTRLGDGQLLSGRYRDAALSGLRGLALFLPLGMLNAADGSPGSGISWVTEWWMPLFYPWYSAITEEIWFRLLLLSLCYFLIRPALRAEPLAAAVAAVLFSGIVFGIGHGRDLETFLTTGLLYGVPLAAVFARRDWEHAVGAHYVINLIPWLAVYLESG